MTEDEANRDFRVVLLNEAKIVCYPFCNITGWRAVIAMIEMMS